MTHIDKISNKQCRIVSRDPASRCVVIQFADGGRQIQFKKLLKTI